MKTVSFALIGAAALALTACGGPAETNTAVDNSVDTLAVPADELAPVDNTLTEIPADSLGNEAASVDANAAADVNAAVDANVAAETNGL